MITLIMLGSVMSLLINANFAPQAIVDWAWRIPFLVGGVFGLVAMYLRRFLEETPVFEAMRQRAELARGLPLASVLKGHGRAVAVSLVACWMLTSAIVVLILQGPTLLPRLAPAIAPEMPLASVASTFTLSLAAVGVGALIDRIGLKAAMLLAAPALIAAAFALFTLALQPGLLLPVYALAGLAVGAVTIVPTMMVNAFPADIRFSGVSFSYNLAYAVFGAATPPLIQILAASFGALGPALYVWRTPTVTELALLLLMGAVGSTGQYFTIRSFRIAEATAVDPIDYTRLILATLIGIAFFSEVPDIWTLVGAAIIVGSTLYIARREARLGHKRAAGPATPVRL